MSQYLKTVVLAVMSVSALSVFFPEDSFGKYVNLLSGIIVMSVVLTPVLRADYDSPLIELPQVDELDISSDEYVMDEFENQLSKRIENKLESEFDKDFFVTVRAQKDEETVAIKEVEIAPFGENYAHIISEYLGMEVMVTQK